MYFLLHFYAGSTRIPTSLLGIDMDVRSLAFESDSFDVVIDKGLSCLHLLTHVGLIVH